MTKTGYIYKLCIKDGSLDDCYIGSTYRIRHRKGQHKASCNIEGNPKYNRWVYQFIRENGSFDNWDLLELDKIEYEDKAELFKKEREWIEKLKPTLNKAIPTRTLKEWRNDNQDKIRQEKKGYRELNKDRIHKKKKEYYKANSSDIIDKSKQYRVLNIYKIKEYQKEYREKNKNKIKEYQNDYYEKNKDNRIQQMKEYRKANKDKTKKYGIEYREKKWDKINAKIKCSICNEEMNKKSLSRHNLRKHK